MIGLRTRVPIVLAALAAATTSSLAGCGGAATPPGAGLVNPSAPAAAATSGSMPAGTATDSATPTPTPRETAMPLTVTSAAFREGGSIPSRYTCDGRDASPPLAWSGAPDGTSSLALIVDDPDARGFVHWVAFGIDGAASGTLPEGISSAAGAPAQGRNDFGRAGYGGPCPPSGRHRYDFTLYALDAPLRLSGTPTAAEVRAAMAGHVLGQATLRGTYTR